MKTLLLIIPLLITLTSCKKPAPTRSTALPDNVVSDKPIVLKEGQTFIVMKEGDPDLQIAVGLSNGKISILELDQKAPHFEVIWRGHKKWETTTTIESGENTTFLSDRNMDGLPDLRAEISPSGTRRFDRIGEEWIELKSTKETKE